MVSSMENETVRLDQYADLDELERDDVAIEVRIADRSQRVQNGGLRDRGTHGL